MASDDWTSEAAVGTFDPADDGPLLAIDRLEAFLDRVGLGAGPVEARRLPGGHSNVTYVVTRGAERFALRRPPLGPLPPSAHDVLREARVLRGLWSSEVPVPRVILECEDTAVLNAPFYVMEYLDGVVLSVVTPEPLADPSSRARIGELAVDALAALHRVEPAALAGLVRTHDPEDYLARQLRRFAGLWERGRTRELPELDAVTAWLADHIPEPQPAAIVHGDFRLGNLMFAPRPPVALLGVLDWEMATVGDPLADLGYLTAHWAQRDAAGTVMSELQPVTREAGYPDSSELARRYAESTGRSLHALGWYEVLALWKAAIFLEQSYRRFLSGNAPDPWFEEMGAGVPELVASAARRAGIGARG